MTDFELGWVAGIIDGEGCIGCYRYGRDKNKKRPIIQVENTSYDIIEKLSQLCGGVNYEIIRRNRPRSKRIWTWRLYGKGLLGFLEKIEPILVSKRERALEIISSLT